MLGHHAGAGGSPEGGGRNLRKTAAPLAQRADQSVARDAQDSSSASDAELSDAVQALTALGYSNSEALRAVRKVKVTKEMQTQDILKQALKIIGL